MANLHPVCRFIIRPLKLVVLMLLTEATSYNEAAHLHNFPLELSNIVTAGQCLIGRDRLLQGQSHMLSQERRH